MNERILFLICCGLFLFMVSCSNVHKSNLGQSFSLAAFNKAFNHGVADLNTAYGNSKILQLLPRIGGGMFTYYYLPRFVDPILSGDENNGLLLLNSIERSGDSEHAALARVCSAIITGQMSARCKVCGSYQIHNITFVTYMIGPSPVESQP